MPTELPTEEIETLVPPNSGELVTQLFTGTELTLKSPYSLRLEVKKEERDSYEKLRQEGIAAVNEIAGGKVTGAAISSVLRAWKYSFEKKEDTLPLDEDSFQERLEWVDEASSFTRVLNHVINGNGQSIGVLPNEGVARVADLIRNQQLEESGLLSEYLAHRVWYAYDVYDKSKPRWEGLPQRPLHIEAEEALKASVEAVTPVLQELMPALAESAEGKASIRRVFEHLLAAEQKELADTLLLAEGLEDEERLTVAVQYINVYGFIPAIETISSQAKVRPEILALYSRLEGNRVTEAMEDVWEVYRKYEQEADFADYYDDEITKKELSLVEKWSGEVGKTFGKTREELYVASLAAGKGRMAIAMQDKGFKVVAIEPQADYAQAIEIKSQGKGIRIVTKKWNELTVEDLGNETTQKDLRAQHVDEDLIRVMGGLEKVILLIGKRDLCGIELGESTGRNLPHGNTPQKLLEAFDSIRSVSKDGAIWIIDVMDPYSGRYKRNINAVRQNLLDLGVEPFQANFTFEGPQEKLRFNRMTVSREQMEAYAELMGLKIREVVEDTVGTGEDSFRNVYYVLEVDKDYYPGTFGQERLQELMAITGLSDPGVNLNERVKSWDLSIGQALVFGFPETTEYKKSISENVRFIRKGRTIQVEGTRTGYRH